MEDHEVRQLARRFSVSRNDPMNVPWIVVVHESATDRAETVVMRPEVLEEAALVQPETHSRVRTPRKIEIPCRSKWVRCARDLGVPDDWRVSRLVQREQPWLTDTPCRFCSKYPVPTANGSEISSPYPLRRLLWVPALGPTPDGVPYVGVNPREYHFGHVVPVIVCPPSNHRVEQTDQVSGFSVQIATNGFPDSIEEGFNVLLRRLDQELAFVFA